MPLTWSTDAVKDFREKFPVQQEWLDAAEKHSMAFFNPVFTGNYVVDCLLPQLFSISIPDIREDNIDDILMRMEIDRRINKRTHEVPERELLESLIGLRTNWPHRTLNEYMMEVVLPELLPKDVVAPALMPDHVLNSVIGFLGSFLVRDYYDIHEMHDWAENILDDVLGYNADLNPNTSTPDNAEDYLAERRMNRE